MPGTPPLNVGGEYGDFRIDAELGRGAMGVVYRAWQHRMNRAVALKVLPADLADDPAYRARFAREAAALARLDSPHVIQIYDYGAHAAPVPQLEGGDPRTEMVNALLAGMLAKEPGERPTIAELRQQIREILAVAGGPAPTTRRTEPGRSAAGRRVRRRVPVILAAVAALLAAGGALVAAALLDPAASAQERLRQAIPIGTTCVETAVPDASADAGALAQAVCGVGGDVGELRLVALAGAADDYLREVALQDPAALPGGSCPDGLPAAMRWDSGRRGGTLLCFVVGPNTRYAWTFDDLDVVAVLDGRAELPFPRDLGAIDAFFTGAQYP